MTTYSTKNYYVFSVLSLIQVELFVDLSSASSGLCVECIQDTTFIIVLLLRPLVYTW